MCTHCRFDSLVVCKLCTPRLNYRRCASCNVLSTYVKSGSSVLVSSLINCSVVHNVVVTGACRRDKKPKKPCKDGFYGFLDVVVFV